MDPPCPPLRGPGQPSPHTVTLPGSWLSWGHSVAPPCLPLGSPGQPRGLPNFSLGVGESHSPFPNPSSTPLGTRTSAVSPCAPSSLGVQKDPLRGFRAGHQQGEMARSLHVISISDLQVHSPPPSHLPSSSVKMGGGGVPETAHPTL